jgi:hypothetical protein
MARLEGIFMPHAHRQRTKAYEDAKEFGNGTDKQDLRIVHYTSAKAALNIIQTKRIWMRNTTCMDDYLEVELGMSILNKYFAKESNKRAFKEALDKSAPGCALKAIERFRDQWNTLRRSIYVTSASEHAQKEDVHGRLSMWRGFGGTTSRVGLVLRIPRYSASAGALKLLFSPVAYLSEPVAHGILDEVTQKIADNCDFLRSVPSETLTLYAFYMFLACAVCVKHEGFQEEREWRAIYTPTLNWSELVETSTEVPNGIPQIVYKLPLDVTRHPDLAATFPEFLSA